MTFTAMTKAVQERYSATRCRARGAVKDYLRHATEPTLDGLLDHAGLVLGRPAHRDTTGEDAALNADHHRHIEQILQRLAAYIDESRTQVAETEES